MKKILLLLFAITLFLVSCEGPMGPEGPQGYGTNWKIINLVANSGDWKENLDQNKINRFYSCHFNIPEITSTVYGDGTIVAYLLIDNAQQVLPYVRHYENLNGAMWTRTIDFDYSVGGVNVYVTNSDFIVDPPEAMNFRLVLMW